MSQKYPKVLKPVSSIRRTHIELAKKVCLGFSVRCYRKIQTNFLEDIRMLAIIVISKSGKKK